MSNNVYRKTTGVVFLAITILHSFRLLYGWEAVIGLRLDEVGGWTVPLWLSWFAVVFAGWLAWSGLRNRFVGAD